MSNIYEDIQWVHNVLKYEISYPLLIRAVSTTLVIYETGLLANKLNKPFSDQLLENPISSQLFEDRFSFGTQFFYAMFLITFLPIFMLECFIMMHLDNYQFYYLFYSLSSRKASVTPKSHGLTSFFPPFACFFIYQSICFFFFFLFSKSFDITMNWLHQVYPFPYIKRM